MKSNPEPSTQEVLAGLVERVTFHNAENGFWVLRAKARGHRDLVTVVGSLGGTRYRVVGKVCGHRLGSRAGAGEIVALRRGEKIPAICIMVGEIRL